MDTTSDGATWASLALPPPDTGEETALLEHIARAIFTLPEPQWNQLHPGTRNDYRTEAGHVLHALRTYTKENQ